MPQELAPQFAEARPFFERFGWTIAEHDSLEADDLLGSFARCESEAGGEALLLTGDRDMYQCAAESVSVLYVKTGSRGAEVVGPAEVERRYGVAPALVPDFIALRGDPSDGIPGARGVGEKTAAELLRRHGSLEKVLEAAPGETRQGLRTSLIGSAEELLDFKRMATLQDAGVERPADRETDWTAAASAASERGINRLAERLAKIAEGAGAGES